MKENLSKLSFTLSGIKISKIETEKRKKEKMLLVRLWKD